MHLLFYTPLVQLIIYIICFILVWIGAGLVVSAVSHLAKFLRFPAFIISFFLLGILTSLPEITISTIAVLNDDPVIVAGTLLGGVVVLLLGVIPLLGVVGNGVKMPTQFDKPQMVATLLVIVAPALLTADQRLGQWEAVLLILMYSSLFAFFSFRQSLWEKVKSSLANKRKNGAALFLKVLLGVAILIGSSNQIVSSTQYFAELFEMSPFFVSFIVVAFGTNIPEISIIFRSVLNRKKDIALADYLGSASANTLLIGVFTLMYGKTIQLPNHFLQRFLFLAVGIVLFFVFARSRKTLSRKESIVLLLLYIAFVIFELAMGL